MATCKKCGKCCKTIAFEMPAPDPGDKAVSKWLEYHDMEMNDLGVWFFPCRCKHLRVDNLCDIYENRPDNCKILPSFEVRKYQPPGCRFFEEEGKGTEKGTEVAYKVPIAFQGQDEILTQR